MADRPTKRPSFQWYPGDAMRDAALRACSLEARGLWREMLDWMHDGEPYGHLTAGGVAIGDIQLAGMVGIPPRRCTALLLQLASRAVFSVTEAGVIYSRRMVRDGASYAEWSAKSSRAGNQSATKRATTGQPPTQPNTQPSGNTASALALASALQPPNPPETAGGVQATQNGKRPTTLEVGELVNRIKSLAQRSPQGHPFIPRWDIVPLGDDVLRAYEAVGGAQRFIVADKYVLRDMGNALYDARRSA